MPGSPPPPCSIALWRGYVAGQFYLREPEGGAALALSPTFRIWRFPWQERKPLDEDAGAVAALAALRADLISDGWERMRRASGSECTSFASGGMDLTTPAPLVDRMQDHEGERPSRELEPPKPLRQTGRTRG